MGKSRATHSWLQGHLNNPVWTSLRSFVAVRPPKKQGPIKAGIKSGEFKKRGFKVGIKSGDLYWIGSIKLFWRGAWDF